MSSESLVEFTKMKKIRNGLTEKRVNVQNELNKLDREIEIIDDDIWEARQIIKGAFHKTVRGIECNQTIERENPFKELSTNGSKKSDDLKLEDLKPEDFTVTTPKSDYDLPFTTETLLKIGRELGHYVLPRGANVISQVLKDRISQAFSHKSLKIEWGNTETIRIETVCDKLILVFSNVVMMENDLTCDQGETFEITSHQVGVMLGSLKE